MTMNARIRWGLVGAVIMTGTLVPAWGQLRLPGMPTTKPATPTTPTPTDPNATPPASTQQAPDSKGEKYSAYTMGKIKEVLDGVSAGGDARQAMKTLDGLFDQVLVYADDNNYDQFREAFFAARMMRQLAVLEDSQRKDTLAYLRANDKVARAVVLAVDTQDNTPKAYELLGRLRQRYSDKLNKYPGLTAAICVVHDRKLQRNMNENKVTAPDPVEVFDYFMRNEAKLVFPVSRMPTELLINVVDVTATPDELEWALKKHGGNANVGALFFGVKYDFAHLRKGAEKKVTAEGYTLPNIAQYGGVCIDQAYYATQVGKALGIPTTIASAQNGTVGHAWVGYLQAEGTNGWWNFNSGRYPEYQFIRGLCEDPQTNRRTPDALVAISAESIHVKDTDRETAAALTRAAQRLIVAEMKGALPLEPAAPTVKALDIRNKPRKPSRTDDILNLLEAALKHNVGDTEAWATLQQLGEQNRLSLEAKRRWSDLALKFCAQRYPDFAVSIVVPMIATVEDIKEQDKLWTALFNMFQKRADLAAEIRIQQAQMWEKNKDPNKAGQCYLDVINRYANAGPFVITALAGAEKILQDQKRAPDVPTLYESAFKQMKAPTGMAGQFAQQSNWYRVGKLLEQRYAQLGRQEEAQKLNATLAAGLGAE